MQIPQLFELSAWKSFDTNYYSLGLCFESKIDIRTSLTTSTPTTTYYIFSTAFQSKLPLRDVVKVKEKTYATWTKVPISLKHTSDN